MLSSSSSAMHDCNSGEEVRIACRGERKQWLDDLEVGRKAARKTVARVASRLHVDECGSIVTTTLDHDTTPDSSIHEWTSILS